jgi:hypothetical protein
MPQKKEVPSGAKPKPQKQGKTATRPKPPSAKRKTPAKAKTPPEQQQVEDIRLVVPDEARETAFMPVRWCCDQRLLNHLAEKEAKGEAYVPHMLILVGKADEEGQFFEEGRFIRPLTEALTYVSFRSSGTYTVLATIVYSTDRDDFNWQVSRYIKRIEDAVGTRSLLRHDVENAIFVYIHNSSLRNIGGGSLRIEVSPEFFAPDPPAWLKAWASLMYTEPPRDQCDFRKRVLRSVFIQPITLPLRLLIRAFLFLILSLGSFLIGSRDYPTDLVRHPFSLGIADCLSSGVTFWWSYHGHGMWDVPRWKKIAWGMTMPAISLSLTAGSVFLCVRWHQEILNVLSQSVYPSIAIALLVALGLSIYRLEDWVRTRVTGLNREQRHELRRKIYRQSVEAEKQAHQEARRQELSALACKVMPLEATVSALPKERQTLRLRFLGLKARRCKPFAKS